MPQYPKYQRTPYSGPGYVQGPPSVSQTTTAGNAQQRTLAIWGGLAKSLVDTGQLFVKERVTEREIEGGELALQDSAAGLSRTQADLRALSQLYEDTKHLPQDQRQGMALTPEHIRGHSRTRGVLKTQDFVGKFSSMMSNLTPEQQQDPTVPLATFNALLKGEMESSSFNDPEFSDSFVKNVVPQRQRITQYYAEKFAENKKAAFLADTSDALDATIIDLMAAHTAGTMDAADTTAAAANAFVHLFNGDPKDPSNNGLYGDGMLTKDNIRTLLKNVKETLARTSHDPRPIFEAFMDAASSLRPGDTEGIYSDPALKGIIDSMAVNVAAKGQLMDVKNNVEYRARLLWEIKALLIEDDPDVLDEALEARSDSLYNRVKEEYADDPAELTSLLTTIGISVDLTKASIAESIAKAHAEQAELRAGFEAIYGVVQAQVDPATGDPVRDPLTGGPVAQIDPDTGMPVMEEGSEGYMRRILSALTTEDGLGGKNLNTTLDTMYEGESGRLLNKALSKPEFMNKLEENITNYLISAVDGVRDMGPKDEDGKPELDSEGLPIVWPPSMRINAAVKRIVPVLANWNAAHPENGPDDLKSYLNTAWNYVQKNNPNLHPKGDLSHLTDEEQGAEWEDYRRTWGEHYFSIQLMGQAFHELVGPNKSWDIAATLLPTSSGIGEAFESVHRSVALGKDLDDAWSKELYSKRFDAPHVDHTVGLASYLGIPTDEITDGSTDPNQVFMNRVMERTQGAVTDDVVGEGGASGLLFGFSHPEEGLPSVSTEDMDYQSKYPVQWAMQQTVLHYAHALNQANANDDNIGPGGSWSQTSKDLGLRGVNKEEGKGVYILGNTIVFDQAAMYGAPTVLEDIYDVTDHDRTGFGYVSTGIDFTNRVNQITSDFISMKQPVEGRSYGYGLVFDKNDKLDVAQGMIAEFADVVDAEDFHNLGRKAEYLAALNDIDHGNMYLEQTTDGQWVQLKVAGRPGLTLLPPVPVEHFRMFFDSRFGMDFYKGHQEGMSRTVKKNIKQTWAWVTK